MIFSMLACPGVLVKVAGGFNGFSTSVMVDISHLNWSSVMALDFLVILVDAIGEGSLFISSSFC